MPATRIETIRRFNRFYTRRIGVLHEGLLQSDFTLTESRLLWELAHHDALTVTQLARLLELDTGYLSRLLSGFKARGLIQGQRSKDDARQQHLRLTLAGQRAFAPLEARSRQEVGALLATLDETRQRQLIASMAAIEQLLAPAAAAPAPGPGSEPPPPPSHQPARQAPSQAPGQAPGQAPSQEPSQAKADPFTLRPHRPGDIGWVISRHGALYADEHGWDIGFEALVARIAADFIERFDPHREACWIAERAPDGEGAGATASDSHSASEGRRDSEAQGERERIGSIFLVQARDAATHMPIDGTAQLRMLLIEPSARGLGLGKRLVDECTGFARRCGYRRIVLWTNANLLAARGIYARAGYRPTGSEVHRSFGHELVGETWELTL